MAETITLKSEARKGKGSRDSARLRKAGRIPAIVYGHKEDPVAITVSLDDLTNVVRHHARTLQLVVAGKNENVLIQEIQHDYLGSDIIHVDFRRVSADEKIRTTVEVELKGFSPGVLGGGVLDQPLHKLHIECSAMSIPDAIRVKIDNLQLGQAIHVKELELPAGVVALEDPDSVVVQVKTAVALVVESVLGEGASNEPEIITKKKEKPTEDE
jgi:large subunit ribosomal protein L25